MSKPATDVLGIGNAIVDVLAETDDAFLERHGLVKGSMTLIDEATALALHSEMGRTVECSGGSAANSMAGLASLGGNAAYIGKVRDDKTGRVFRDDIQRAGVRFETPAAAAGPPTARSMIFVTPDAQRTMQTLLGAAATLGPGDIDADLVRSAGITFLEGYLWDPQPAKQALLRAAKIAHEARRKVALSLSDSFCVDRHRDEFRELVEQHVDVLFANEAEALSLYQVDDLQPALDRLLQTCELAAVTRGAEGSLILHDKKVSRVAADPVERVVDTTGAGDLYAAGFLFGLSQGRAPETCGRIGSIAAGEIVSHVGARPATSLARLVASRL